MPSMSHAKSHRTCSPVCHIISRAFTENIVLIAVIVAHYALLYHHYRIILLFVCRFAWPLVFFTFESSHRFVFPSLFVRFADAAYGFSSPEGFIALRSRVGKPLPQAAYAACASAIAVSSYRFQLAFRLQLPATFRQLATAPRICRRRNVAVIPLASRFRRAACRRSPAAHVTAHASHAIFSATSQFFTVLSLPSLLYARVIIRIIAYGHRHHLTRCSITLRHFFDERRQFLRYRHVLLI